MLKKLFCITAIITICYTLSGCAIYNATVDERNISEQYSDTVISASILNKLVKSDHVSSMGISVKTYNGKVYLIGEVDSLTERSIAISLARNVKGVRSVIPYLLLKNKKDFCGTTDNVSMSTKLKTNLVGDKEVWSTNISIDVVQCNIVLTGIVGSTREKQKIIQHAKRIPEARSVTSYIQVQ